MSLDLDTTLDEPISLGKIVQEASEIFAQLLANDATPEIFVYEIVDGDRKPPPVLIGVGDSVLSIGLIEHDGEFSLIARQAAERIHYEGAPATSYDVEASVTGKRTALQMVLAACVMISIARHSKQLIEDNWGAWTDAGAQLPDQFLRNLKPDLIEEARAAINK